jgi:hypothetical protein
MTIYPPGFPKLLPAIFAVATAFSASAQESRDQQITERFAAADTDQNGTVTLAEIKALADR